ncbi:hypothetical protein SERLA73DRAFT_181044 [Serpula lacrymans var. lacrymans S7.3]|uniref:Uncharacterized protein n=2 Tax=Serpula lacrymans var. lacrymans TaxID=341189 RepID=F8PUN5_SERL3|nr:uncharacterized protein SERLADRAFT_466920 [Serpula lacrymans var. lacrymans S7.9]EGO00443.1 hypothetical protein SERLA73DRAFT_181044 [Serpula lacrymans var. lacrymans S7.3]EGO26000.1 hypothetical protein SERLADRAFT_466920 [Serpula lacrymans var. lacrymans S7.9]
MRVKLKVVLGGGDGRDITRPARIIKTSCDWKPIYCQWIDIIALQSSIIYAHILLEGAEFHDRTIPRKQRGIVLFPWVFILLYATYIWAVLGIQGYELQRTYLPSTLTLAPPCTAHITPDTAEITVYSVGTS